MGCEAPISRRSLLRVFSVFPAARLLWGQRQNPTFSADVKVVSLLATVRNKQGQIVRDLTQDDFLLDEDGRPQTIRYFARETDLPLTLGLLVDTSGSQRRVLGDERIASYRFFEQVLREQRDLAFIIHFDFDVELLQDLTSSRRKLEAALEELDSPSMQRQGGAGRGPLPGSRGGGRGRGGPGGGTDLYDAVLLASDELMKKQSGRKALILLSDGVDTGSKTLLADAVESAQRADTLAYSILFEDPDAYGGGFGGFGGPRMGRRGGGPMMDRPDGKRVLEKISKETGGRCFEVSKRQPLQRVFEAIEEDLRNQYSLGYTPDRADDSRAYRRIHLATKQRGLIVQTREGYYPG
jgi:VWFA-related protein